MPDWLRTRDEVARLAPGEPEYSWLLWLEARLGSEGFRPMPQWWAWAYREFWRSGKRQMTASVGRRGTKSSSNCRVATCEMLYRKRRVEPGTEIIWPILSCDMTEANGRAVTLREILKRIGLAQAKDQSTVDAHSYWAQASQGGRTRIVLWDADGHPVEFRISPASIKGASGFTAPGGTCDEVDLWHDDENKGGNPANEVFKMLLPTLKGQKGAHLYSFSAPFGERGPHTLSVREGDTELQHVSRLGELGARYDEEARAGLALYFAERARTAKDQADHRRFTKYAADPRLRERADPMSTEIPSWVANPTNEDGDGPDPVGAIRECYALAARESEKDGADPLIELLARYGARPYAAGGERLLDAVLLDEATRRAPAW